MKIRLLTKKLGRKSICNLTVKQRAFNLIKSKTSLVRSLLLVEINMDNCQNFLGSCPYFPVHGIKPHRSQSVPMGLNPCGFWAFRQVIFFTCTIWQRTYILIELHPRAFGGAFAFCGAPLYQRRRLVLVIPVMPPVRT